MMVSFVLSLFPRDVLDEILNLIESVSEDFPSYSSYSSRAGAPKRQRRISAKKNSKADDIGPVGCIFVNFDKYTYQPHDTIVVQNEIKIHQQKRKRTYLYMQ